MQQYYVVLMDPTIPDVPHPQFLWQRTPATDGVASTANYCSRLYDATQYKTYNQAAADLTEGDRVGRVQVTIEMHEPAGAPPVIESDLHGFFQQLDADLTPQQRALFTRCAALQGDAAHAVLGGLLRIMLEPDQDFWPALEEVFQVLETHAVRRHTH